jgi:hypothetical protein
MGNALQGTIAALDKGLIGGNPLESKFAAIDKGIKDVQDWKANIDKQRLDLKKTTAKSIREAEKYAAENMPSNDTAAAKMVESLAKFKEDAFISEKLVRNGNVPPEENLIFQENGKQTFEILSDFVKTFGDEIDITEERAKGKYITNDKGEQIFVKPQSGELEAIKQQIQTQIGTLAGVDVNFDDKGMGIVDFYKMEVDEKTKTLVRKLDKDGNPIYIDGQSGMSVLALKHKANTRADRIYITDQVQDFANSAVGTNYEIMVKDGLMVGNVITDSRNNPDIKASVNNQVAANTTNIEHVASLFTSENGMGGKLVSFTDYDNLTDAQKKETFTVDILDENLEAKKVTVPKYSRIAAANSNNAIVPEMTEEQIEAVKGYNRRSLVAGLQRKIKKGDKKSEFQRSAASIKSGDEEKDFQASVDLIDLAATGDASSLKALVAENSDKISAYNIIGAGEDMELVFIDADGNNMAPIPLSGLGVDAGKQIAAQLQLKAQRYFDKSKLKGTNKKAGGTEGKYKTVTKEYGGLGAFNIGVSEENGIKRAGTAAETFANAIKNNPEENEVVGVANTIIQKAVQEYDIDSNISVRFDDVDNSIFDRYIITVDGVDYASPGQISRKNHAWLEENMDKVLRGEKPQGTTESTPNVG